MTVLVSTSAVEMWMIYPFELAYGFGGMVNMTAQRELLFRVGGPQGSSRVLNIELTGMASAMMLGPLVGGVTIAAFGLTPEYHISSTDANIPMSLGIPAITLESGASGARNHTLDEWIDVEKTSSVRGIQVAMGILLSLAGLL